MGKVWDTTLPANEKIVLLAYADHANDDGTSIYPGQDRMCVKTSYSAATISRITKGLVASGVLERVEKGRRGHRAVFKIDLEMLDRITKAPHHEVLTVDELAPHLARVSTSSERVSTSSDALKHLTHEVPTHHEPSVTIKEPSIVSNRSRNHGWDFVTDPAGPFGLATRTPRQQQRAGGLAKDINAVLDHHGVPDDSRPLMLLEAAGTWPDHFEQATLTADAFAKHLPALLRQPLKANTQTLTSIAEERAIAELTQRKALQ